MSPSIVMCTTTTTSLHCAMEFRIGQQAKKVDGSMQAPSDSLSSNMASAAGVHKMCEGAGHD